MSHSVCGFNKAGEEVFCVDFSYRNSVATSLYQILDAYDYHAGVSGSGDSAVYSLQQMEKALDTYKEIFNSNVISHPNQDPSDWYQKQVLDFILKCLETAQNEGEVRVYFG